MKKITGLMLTLVFLSGCVESVALLGPMSGSGNMAQSALSSSVSYGVKKQTGKSPIRTCNCICRRKKYVAYHLLKKLIQKKKKLKCKILKNL